MSAARIALHNLKKALNPRAWARGRALRPKVALVTVRGQRFKRLRLPDTYAAIRTQNIVEALSESPHVPRAIMRSGNDLWVDYVEGSPVRGAHDADIRGVADLYADLYARSPRQEQEAHTAHSAHLLRDLAVIRDLGALTPTQHDELLGATERLVPSRVWLGFDYVDAGLENFVRAPDGRVWAIDLENLVRDQVLGVGLASARVRWPDGCWQRLWRELGTCGIPALDHYAFVELYYRAQWIKRKLLKGKTRRLAPGAYALLREAILRNKMLHNNEEPPAHSAAND